MRIAWRLSGALLAFAPIGCGDDPLDAADAPATDAQSIDAPPAPDAGFCAYLISCPPATAPNKVSICGQIHDTQTTAPIDNGEGSVASRIEVQISDAVGGGPPLAIVYPDDCGRYRAADVAVASGVLVVATEDVASSPGDLYVLTAVTVAMTGGQTNADVNAFATRRETDDGWTFSAGLTGESFATRGVYVAIFVDPLRTHWVRSGASRSPACRSHRAVRPTRPRTTTSATSTSIRCPEVRSIRC